MGVNHLKRDAAIGTSQAAQGHTNSPQSKQVTAGTHFARPAQNSGTRHVPTVSPVNSFSEKNLHPGGAPGQPPKGNANGGRAGAKSGQPMIGERSGLKRGMSGGRMG